MQSSISPFSKDSTLKKSRIFPTRIGITGSPGTGKKSVAIELAKISGLNLLLINDFAIKHRFGVLRNEEFVVDLRRARKAIDTDGRIICGHLLPYIVPKSELDFVVVLRCSPNVLKKRYRKRGYSPEKINENLEAEMIGVIAEKAMTVYGSKKLIEFNTTRTRVPGRVAKRVLEIMKGDGAPTFGKVDWLYSQRSHMALIKSFSRLKPITKP
ncbi:MAG: adenylate kinase family protein [Nitrososphaerales archaeon]